MSKFLHIKDNIVRAISLPGEPLTLTYGQIIEVDDTVEVGVGDTFEVQEVVTPVTPPAPAKRKKAVTTDESAAS